MSTEQAVEKTIDALDDLASIVKLNRENINDISKSIGKLETLAQVSQGPVGPTGPMGPPGPRGMDLTEEVTDISRIAHANLLNIRLNRLVIGGFWNQERFVSTIKMLESEDAESRMTAMKMVHENYKKHFR